MHILMDHELTVNGLLNGIKKMCINLIDCVLQL